MTQSVDGPLECPQCGESVIEVHKTIEAWGETSGRKVVTYHCSSGQNHLPWGWTPEQG